MKKVYGFLACLLLIVSVALSSVPDFALHLNRYVGVIVSYIGNSGTNSVLEVVYDAKQGVPFKVAEVSALVDTGSGPTSTPVVVYRVWEYTVDRTRDIVSTNLFGTVETNTVFAGQSRTSLTNEIYDSASDTLPTSGYLLSGDMLQADFAGVTNVTLRIIGTD